MANRMIFEESSRTELDYETAAFRREMAEVRAEIRQDFRVLRRTLICCWLSLMLMLMWAWCILTLDRAGVFAR